jgi:hypothetical protein
MYCNSDKTRESPVYGFGQARCMAHSVADSRDYAERELSVHLSNEGSDYN